MPNSFSTSPAAAERSVNAERRRLTIARLIIVFAIGLALWPLCDCDFTTWDDTETVSQNPTLNPPTLNSIKIWWMHPIMDIWDPATNMLDGALAEVATVTVDPVTGTRLNPYVFHTANVLLHIGSSLLVFHILRQLGFTLQSACAAALLFGLHPVQVEPVGWLSGLKDALYVFLSLAAIGQYLTFSRPRFWIATALFVVATWSKPTAIVVPLIVLIVVFYQQRHIQSRVWRQMVLWVILSLPCIVITKIVQPASGLEPIAFWKRALVALDALAFYACKLLWPASLGVDYGRTPSYVLRHGWAYWTWVFPVGLAIALWLSRHRSRALIAGAGIFVAGLLPVLGLVPFDFQHYSTVADHYLYLPMLGVATCAAWLLEKVQSCLANSDRTPSSRTRFSKLAAVVTILILLCLGTRSWFQTRHWRDSRALFTNAVEVNPASAGSWSSLAGAYLSAGDMGFAARCAMKAVELAPNEPQYLVTLGAVLANEGKLDAATRVYQKAYAIDPTSAMTASELAGALAQQNHLVEAIPLARRAVALDPNLADAHMNLGSMLAHQRNFPEAIAEFRNALRLKPQSIQAHMNLAAVLAAMGRREEAIQQYQAVMEIDPQSPAARRGLEKLNGGQ